jgi:hypothetical protein
MEQQQAHEPKKAYATPALENYGDISLITQNTTSGLPIDSAFSGSKEKG